MEVIFIKNLKNQGKKGEIKEVKDGYAENFLIKNGYAVKKTAGTMKSLETYNKKEEAEDLKNREEAKKIKEQIEKENYKFQVKTGKDERVFGSISIKQIKNKLDEKYHIEKNMINLDHPITSLGYHNVEIILYKDIKATLRIELVK